MKQREKILAAVLIVGAFVMWGFPLLKGLIFGGIEDRQIKLTSLLRAEETIDDNELQLLAARKNLSKWEHRSLPPDAEEAELLYQEWLTDLAQIAGLTSVHVIPQPPAPRTSDKYATVRIDIKAEATFEQLTAFLQDFRRVDLMHRISALKIEGAKNPGGPLKIEATAEGLCLKDASSRMDSVAAHQARRFIAAKLQEFQSSVARGFSEGVRIRHSHRQGTFESGQARGQ